MGRGVALHTLSASPCCSQAAPAAGTQGREPGRQVGAAQDSGCALCVAAQKPGGFVPQSGSGTWIQRRVSLQWLIWFKVAFSSAGLM